MQKFYRDNRIVHETSCVDTPQQNERVERKHRHILEVARALRFQACLPIEFWGECILTAAYLINITPTTKLHGKSPHEILFGTKPSYRHIKIFGCLCYAHNNSRQKDKFGARSRRCVFVGYPYGKKGWKLYDLEKKVFFSSRDVSFHEDVFPFAQDIGQVEQRRDAQVTSGYPFDEDQEPETPIDGEPQPRGEQIDTIMDERGSTNEARDESVQKNGVEEDHGRQRIMTRRPVCLDDYIVYSAHID